MDKLKVVDSVKMKISIRQTTTFSGEVVVTQEQYGKYRQMYDMDFINSMMLKGLSKRDFWHIEEFHKI